MQIRLERYIMPGLAIIVIALLALVMRYQSYGTRFGEKDVLELGHKIVLHLYDYDYGYYSKKPWSLLNPNVYNLYNDGNLNELYFSSKYWINIERNYDKESTGAGEWFINYYIVILLRSNQDKFYLITNKYSGFNRELMELRKYPSSELTRISELISDNADFNDIKYDRIGEYQVEYEPEYRVIISYE